MGRFKNYLLEAEGDPSQEEEDLENQKSLVDELPEGESTEESPALVFLGNLLIKALKTKVKSPKRHYFTSPEFTNQENWKKISDIRAAVGQLSESLVTEEEEFPEFGGEVTDDAPDDDISSEVTVLVKALMKSPDGLIHFISSIPDKVKTVEEVDDLFLRASKILRI